MNCCASHGDSGRGVVLFHDVTVREKGKTLNDAGGMVMTTDLWLTPTLSAPPLPVGAMASTADDPMGGLGRGAGTIRYAGIIANISGNPAMSVPLAWNADGSETSPYLARIGYGGGCVTSSRT